MIQKTFFSLLIFFSVTSLFAQEFYKKDPTAIDSATFMIWGSPNFSVQFPFGQGYLASTFRFDMCAGVDITIKTQTNWTIDVAFNYMFGSKIKKPAKDIIGDIATIFQDSIMIVFNGEGFNSLNLKYEGRYWYLGATVGKVFPLNRWKNSGLWLKFGAGYFGHKIHFVDPNDYFPQLFHDKNVDYRLGYDQRSQGISLNQFFGYMFMQKRRTLSFYIGVELWEIFSKPDRGYIFVGDLKGPTDQLPRKFSGLFGIKFGWILPFYEKNKVTTYYYY